MIAAGAAAALALVGTPALVGTASAAPSDNAAAAATANANKVGASKWGSYVVVMKGNPLTTSFGQKALGSTKAQQQKKALEAKHDGVLKKAGVGASKKLNDYTASLNGFSVLASQAQAKKIAANPDVLMVTPDELRQKASLPMAAGDDEITETKPETLRGFLGTETSKTKGDKELLGVIDTGIWPEHPSFADDGTYPRRALGNAKGGFPKCDFGRGKEDKKFVCNNKLIGARQMLKTYRQVVGILPGEFNSARDDDGHGTHTASTAAGNENVRAWIYDKTRTLDYTSGVAPRAQIVAYKALGSLGGFSSDLAAAIDQAVYDGVDVINYSVGGGPGLLSADALSFLYANQAGVHVATSAGNSGPDPATIGGPADLPWVTTVGASTQPRFYAGTVSLGNGQEVRGSSVTLASAPNLPLVDAKVLGNEQCVSKAQLGDDAAYASFAKGAKGAMVLCWRGAIGRSEKSLNVLEAGGKAMVLSNQNDVDNYFTDNFRVPTVMVDKTEGDVIAAYAESSGADAKASITNTGAIRTFEPAPSMAIFSSRGPNPSAPSIIKPDITAPGVQVLAGASPAIVGDDYEPGQLFQAIAGTSMSSPVMAGVFLLIDQLHPTWTPSMVKSAAMTTAYQDVRDNDRTTRADPFDFGAGHVKAISAFNPGLVYNSGFNDFLGFYCGSDARNDIFADPAATCGRLAAAGIPTRVEDLNYPTIGISALAGVATAQRKVTNVLGSKATFTASVENPTGLVVKVSPAELTLNAGETGSFTVTITNETAKVNSGWQFGSLTWKGAGATVRSNIAVYPTAISAPSTVAGSGADGSVTIPVTTGYEGTYTPIPGGLATNDPLTGSVSQDPDQTFAGCTAQPGVAALPFTVVADTAYVRLSYVLSSADDIDLYLCHEGKVVAESTAGGTNELIELNDPAAGDYTLYVHGWQVVTSPLAASIDRWQVVRGVGTPELTVLPKSAPATIGGTIEVTASWVGAPSGTSFGVVDHTESGGASLGMTVVQVTNP
ncbi:MAG: S8 family serine peptidase [Ornithinibacter sp.]